MSVDDFWTGVAGLSRDALYRLVTTAEPTSLEDIVGDDPEAQMAYLKTL
jgi:hypothetical protein